MEQFADLLGESPSVEAARRRLRRILARAQGGRRLPPILIGGETGTGKGLIARLIHRHGPRANGPFVEVNCAAIPDSLLEAELFGFERGAFTDARRAKPGLFQTAHRGTIFLDEIGLLPEALQAKLLKVLEEQAVRRLGSTHSEPLDVSIISATNADLKAAIAARHFREDLYHRLAVLTLELSPLRERGRDIILLAHRFLAEACTDYGLAAKRLALDAEERLQHYPWPGNIRELGNVMERVALLVEGDVVHGHMLDLADSREPMPSNVTPPSPPLSATIRDHLVAALEDTGWNISRTALRLNLSRNTVRARIARFGLARGASSVVPGRAPARVSSSTGPSVASRRAAHEPAAAAPVAIRWERRRLTFLRATLIRGEADEGPVEVNRALDTLLQKTRSFGARIEEIGQRRIGAVFGLEPVEDAPRRAAHAAMAIQKAADRARQNEGDGFAVKLGLDVAEVLVGKSSTGSQIDAEARREEWSTLDRLLESGGAGRTLVTRSAMSFLERRFELTPESDAPDSAYRLLGRERKGLSPEGHMARFVGRDPELDLLKSRFMAAKTGNGQLACVAGEAGIGKSRLLHEFRQSLRGEAVTYLEGRCLSYASTIPYFPVIEILRRGCRINDDDTVGQVAQKLGVALKLLWMPPDETVPHLMRFLGFKEGSEPLERSTPEAIRERTLQILRQMFVSASHHRPTVLVIEDLHWVDPATENLTAMVTMLAGLPLLVILTYRPDYRPSWLDRSAVTKISLQPLSDEESLGLLKGMVSSNRLSDSVAQEIIDRADGNPFFLEELGRAVREEGSVATRDEVPHTVQDVLRARMNRLPERERRLLQTAAAIGRDVPVLLLAGVSDLPEPDLSSALHELRAGEFLYETMSPSEAQYSFRHALTHEVAYGSLLPAERRILHARSVETIESLHPDRLLDFAERLADHALLGEIWDKAVDYLREAGARAFARGAVEEALARYDQALAASDRLPRTPANMCRAIDVRVDLHTPLLVLGQVSRLVELHRQAEPLARELGDPQRLSRLFQRMSQYSWMEAKYEAGVDYARQSLDIATSTGDPDGLVLARYSLAQSLYSMGQYQTASELFIGIVDGPDAERAKRLLAATISVYIAVCGWLGQALSQLGQLDRAIAYADLGVQAADESGHPQAQAVAYTLAAIPRVSRGDIAEAVSLAEQSLRLCETKRLLTWFPGAASTFGWALTAADRAEEGLPYLERGPSILAALGVNTHLAVMYVRWAEALLMMGRRAEAHDVARRAIETAVVWREGGHEAEAYCMLASVLAAGDPRDAEAAAVAFEDALAKAEALGMRPIIARCHLGLGQLLNRRGEQVMAGEHLARAATHFRALGMRPWLERAQAAIGESR